MFFTNFVKFITFFAVILILDCANSDPVTQSAAFLPSDNNKQSSEELSDLNAIPKELAQLSAEESDEESKFSHLDEDQLKTAINLGSEKSLKYDVEVLEARDIKKEDMEIEERFTGPAIKVNTDNLVTENIEMESEAEHNNGTDDDVSVIPVVSSHMIVNIILLVIGVGSIGIYVALVMWRSHLEQRYGMHELLITDDDFTIGDYSNSSTPRHSILVP